MKKIGYRTEVLVALLVVLIFLFFVVFVGYWGWIGKWMGQESPFCNDNKPCTLDKIYPDGVCLHPELNNQTYCSPTDVCYNSSCGAAYCQSGVCVGQRECCRGVCNVDADCPELPWSPRLNDNPLGTCISHSCVYIIIGTVTAECNSWIDNPPDNPVAAQGCIIFRFTDEAFAFPPGICLFRYSCATFDFSSKRTILMDEDEIYNKSMEAIHYFKSNDLWFHDIPQYGENLIYLHNQILELVNNSKTSYTTSKSMTKLNKKPHQTNHKQIDNHLLKKHKKIN